MRNLIANKEREFHLPLFPSDKKIRIMISSLALGGAEKIVLDWAKAEVNAGKDVEIAVLYKMDKEWPIPSGVKVFRKSPNTPVGGFIAQLTVRWKNHKGAISTHLIRDNVLSLMWNSGFKTIPVFHNGKEGWKNDPSNWSRKNVPFIIGCADAVSKEIREEVSDIPVYTIKHQASVSKLALSMDARKSIRNKLHIPDNAILIGLIGALKRQKNYPKAVEVLAEVNKQREAYLCILGGILNDECKEELNKVLAKAKELNIAKNIRLVGFVNPIDSYLAAFDVVLNTSFHEGFSIATQEALVAGLPVVASKVNGQKELCHENLVLMEQEAPLSYFAIEISKRSVRKELVPSPTIRADKIWTIPNSWEPSSNVTIDTLLITSNLNAGGAQRSLVNLSKALKQSGESIGIGVCNGSTNPYFSNELKNAGVTAFQLEKTNEVFDIASSILKAVYKFNISKLCYWNCDPKIKLLLSKFLPNYVEMIDVSPGAYAFDELEDTKSFQEGIRYSSKDYFERLDHLVFKHGNGNENIPYNPRQISVVQNGVEQLPMNVQPEKTKFLVNGRIADSKHLKTIIKAYLNFYSIADKDSELIIYGQAEARNTDYLKDVLSLAENNHSIKFMGQRADLKHLSNGYTSIIVLGTNQGCPNAVLEAMSAGIPVIANDSGGTRELVSEKNGILLPEKVSETLLLNAMLKVNKNEDLKKMGMESQRIAYQKFSMDRMHDKYKEIFSSKEELRKAV